MIYRIDAETAHTFYRNARPGDDLYPMALALLGLNGEVLPPEIFLDWFQDHEE